MPTRSRYHHVWRGLSRDPSLPLGTTLIDVLIFPCSFPAANWLNWELSITTDMWCLTQPGDGTAPDESLLNDKSVSCWWFITVLSWYWDVSQLLIELLIEDKMVKSDICDFCVIGGFQKSQQMGTSKQELAYRKHREPIRLLYDFTNRCRK